MSFTFLWDSRGRHIANLVDGHLHSPRGLNIGHEAEEGIFIDMRGRYLGEIVNDDRLLYNRSSPYRSTNYGVYGNVGNVGNAGNPGNAGAIGLPAGFSDVEITWAL
jgi:hypothetical protein